MGFKKILDALTGRGAQSTPEEGEAPPSSSDPGPLLEALLEEAAELRKRPEIWSIDSARTEAGRRILGSDAGTQLAVLRLCLDQLSRRQDYDRGQLLKDLAGQLLRRKLPSTEADLTLFARAAAHAARAGNVFWHMPMSAIVGLFEAAWAGEIPPGPAAAIEDLVGRLRDRAATADERRLVGRLERLLRGPLPAGTLSPAGPWTEAVCADLAGMDPAERSAWVGLLDHGAVASGARPTRKWSEETAKRIAALGPEPFAERAAEWIGLGPAPGATKRGATDDTDADRIRGLVWAATTVGDAPIAEAIGDMAEACFRKVPGVGPVSAKVGNACVYALGQLPGTEAVSHLSRLKARVKYATALRLIDKALDEAAARAGMSRADLEEIAVPTFGIDPDGILRRAFGDWRAEVTVGAKDLGITWVRFDGKAQKSVPADVKAGNPDELKALQKTVKEIEKQLPGQRARLERLETLARRWRLLDWRARLLEHPLLGVLARRLVWTFEENGRRAEGIWFDGRLVDVRGEPIDGFGPDATVSIWHPLGSPPEGVLGWRRFLEGRGIVQPFKQAHREVYEPSAAEREDGTESERFAGHVLRQHQFAALCRDRGWSYRLMGGFDSFNVPVRDLPGDGLRVEFEVAAEQDDAAVSDSYIYLHVTSGPVRFLELGTNATRPLASIPPLVYSEVMRDVDLFVGVCGIAGETDFPGQGGAPRHEEYWRSAAFGVLTPTAETRRDVLGALLPRLRIADRCALEDRFLVVRGSLRAYRIHLGSGNVQTEDGVYLPLVLDRKAAARDPGVVLPFEGDGTLAAILAKAFALADDARITEPAVAKILRG